MKQKYRTQEKREWHKQCRTETVMNIEHCESKKATATTTTITTKRQVENLLIFDVCSPSVD